MVRLRPERSEFKANERDNRSDMPDRCVRAVDSSTLELWNCRNSEESIRYRWERKLSGFTLLPRMSLWPGIA